MTRWLSGEVLFGAFMIAVFLAGAYDLLSVGGLSAVFDDSGIVFALVIILLSVALLAVVTLTPRLHTEERGPFMAKRGVVIALVGLSYPVLFWAFEYLIATALVGFVALGLFTEKFGRKQATIALVFTLGSYLLFFFLLGITEADGAIFSTGLNDVVPTWRRDFFQSF
jgi:hypothetical protein